MVPTILIKFQYLYSNLDLIDHFDNEEMILSYTEKAEILNFINYQLELTIIGVYYRADSFLDNMMLSSNSSMPYYTM